MKSRLKPKVKLPIVGVKRNEGVNDTQIPNHQQATKQNLNNQDAFNQVYRDLSHRGSFSTKIQNVSTIQSYALDSSTKKKKHLSVGELLLIIHHKLSGWILLSFETYLEAIMITTIFYW
jgi:hypothetical protein